MAIANSELILNNDGSIYHLHLLPEDISNTIITVGDPDRVLAVSSYFDSIRIKKQKREFCTVTGRYKGKELTVISTGIGTDNIDIVFTELDALANINLTTRLEKEEKTALTFIRIGTSGTMQENIEVDSFLASVYGIGFDGLMNFYAAANTDLPDSISNLIPGVAPYLGFGDEELLNHFSDGFQKGATVTCSGFYAPQGRELRLKAAVSDWVYYLSAQKLYGVSLTNFEMETAGIYALSNALGHRAISLNAILANRKTGKFSSNPSKTVKNLIEKALDRIVELP